MKTDLVEAVKPLVACELTVVASAPRDEASHAVPDDHELGQRHRPAPYEGFESFGERAPVRRDVEAAVVVQIYRRVAEIPAQARQP
jgi:hypothetical protein